MAMQDSSESSRGVPSIAPTSKRRRVQPKWLFWSAFIPLIILSGLLSNWAFLAQLAFAASASKPYSAPGYNTFQQFLQESQNGKANQSPFQRPSYNPGVLKPSTTSRASTTLQRLPSAEPVTMKNQDYTLDNSFVLNRPTSTAKTSLPAKVQGTAIPTGITPLVAQGSDGRLEADLPRGALDLAHAALADGSAPVGQLILQIHQIVGHYIGSESILGAYQLQVVDSQGNVVQGIHLIKPLTIVYHYQSWEMQDLNLDPNAVHLAWSALLAAAEAAKQPTTGLVIPFKNNATAHTLTAQTMMLSGPMTASGTPEIQAPATPDLFEASGNAGQYAYSYPLSVAPGPDGFAPQLALSYSSQSTNERHSRRAPAGAEGEGFSLSLGSITAVQYPATSTEGAGTWYFLNGVDGISDRLVPSTTPGYYETQHMSHLSIQFHANFWRIFGLDGTFYELGYTPGTMRKTSAGSYEWDMDKILAPFNSNTQVKTMIITYLQDSPDGGTTIRDAGIKQIQYGYETNNSGTPSLNLVAGTVDFHYHMPNVPGGQGNFATAYGTNYNCTGTPPASTTLRCDDPGVFGSIPAPDVMSTMSLDSVTSYIGSDSAQPAYRYDFAYQDRAYDNNYFDPYTFVQQATSGEHLLTQITPTVYLQGTAHARKGVAFTYANWMRDGYNDPSVPALLSGHVFSGQTFWSYLVQYQDLNTGEGAKISYATANGNPQGTPYIADSHGNVIDDRFDPLYCTHQANNGDPTKHCSNQGTYGDPENFSWGLQVVTQIQALGTDSSGNQTVATTTYNYALTAVPSNHTPTTTCNPITGPGVPPQEQDCVVDNWSPGYNGTPTQKKDGDWADYYHAEFRGFNIVYTTSSSNNLTADYYFTTQGWWYPASDGLNYEGGQLYQQDVYQGNAATPSALLRETLSYYLNVPFPAGAPYDNLNGCNGNENAIYTPCVVAALTSRTTFFEGNGGSASVPWVQKDDTYDDVNTSKGYTYTTAYHNLQQEVITSSNAPTLTKKWTYQQPNVQNDFCCNSLKIYVVDKVVHSEIDDSNGHVWQCQNTTYDEGTGVSVPTGGLPTTVTSYSTCGNSSTALNSYTGYDVYGNAVATVDPLGAANPSLYSGHGCSLSTAPIALSSAWTTGRYTSCTTYDANNTAGLPVTATNVLGQTVNMAYDYSSGARPTGTTDANSQTSSFSYAYDGSGNETINVSSPGESGSYTTRQNENSQCTASSTLPCYEIDSNSLLYSSAISRTFYDAHGRAVETRTPGPTPGDDTVVYTVYNDQTNSVFKSEPFQVADGSGWLDPNGAKDINGVAPAGTASFMDALGRTIAMQDPNFGSVQEPGLSCSTVLGGNYTSCVNYGLSNAENANGFYEAVSTIDANNHLSVSFSDALGRVVFTQQYRGLGRVPSTNALLYSGMVTSTNEAFAYMKLFDLSSQNVVIGPTTTLSYWIFPQSQAGFPTVSGTNSTCVAVDAYFTDGSDLRDSGAVDQHGNRIHPAGQCGHLALDQWNYVTTNIGTVLNGKTFSMLDMGYDQSGQTGGYRGYIDDITISNPGNPTPLFATDFENGSPQPTWANTPYNSGAVQNVGGVCCSLTGPESFVGAGIGHVSRVVKQVASQYNALNKPTSITTTDYAPQSGQSVTSVTTTATYDDLGRVLASGDPDQGTFSYTYDPDGRVISVVQTSGSSSRTMGTNYDLLGRPGCVQDAAPTLNTTGACSAGHPYVQNTYDTTKLGTQGSTDFPVGHLTQSVATTYFPDGSSATTTQQAQFDQRGRAVNAQMQIGLPSSWNVTTALPAFQMSQTYNDANQPTTTTANAGGQSYTFTQVYDGNNGVLQGLSNNGSSTANVATLAYNEFAQLAALNYQSTTNTALATDQFSYDGNLRPISLTASWLPGSGTSGQIIGQGRSYDNASNVTGVTTTLAPVSGKSGSGGTETQNFCYDEQNRLLWAGNNGTQPGAGNGTCGSGTLGNTLSGGAYTNVFAYTNLGQIWQGPVNGQGSAKQYLYCNPSQPHQLTGIYPLGTTCSNPTGALYTASYDPWGNVTSRTFSGTTATLSYDNLNRMVEWNTASNGQEFYVYDASGSRVLKRSTSGSSTTMIVYAYGLQELYYHANGTAFGGTNNNYYYSLAGHLIGATDGTNTIFYLTDAQGSVLSTISAVANSAVVQGNQTYGPYGNQRYKQGILATSKGYTGQYHDSVTGLDYYNARYYDSVAAVFLSPDSVQGNAQGMNPYTYVGENPETRTDPTGQRSVGNCDSNEGGDCNPNGTNVPPPPPQPKDPYCDSRACFDGNGNIVSYLTPRVSSGGTHCGCIAVPATVKPVVHPAPKPEDIVKGQQKARNIASDAAGFFGLVGGFLGALGIVLGLIALANEENPLGWLLTGIAFGLASLALKYLGIALAFDGESRGDLSWFAVSNLQSQFIKMSGTIAGVSVAIQLGFAASLINKAIKAVAVTDRLVSGVLVQVITSEIVDGIGSNILQQQIINYTNQQQLAVLT